MTIVKLGEADAARVRAGNWASYVAGSPDNDTSLPVDYELDGFFLEPLIPGFAMRVYRIRRNGLEVPGLFTTSRIVRLLAVTENSVYRIEPATARK